MLFFHSTVEGRSMSNRSFQAGSPGEMERQIPVVQAWHAESNWVEKSQHVCTQKNPHDFLWPPLTITHRLSFILEPVPYDHISIPATSSQQAILGVKGYTVHRARAGQGCYLMTFSWRPHLIDEKHSVSMIKEDYRWLFKGFVKSCV